MKWKHFVVLFLVLLFCILTVDASKKKNRYRGKKTKANCHLKELDKCLTKLERYKNDTESYKLIKNSRGLDEICSNSQEAIQCFGDQVGNCGTPLQKEMFDFATEQFIKSIDLFCKPGELREEFLKHSPCVADNVLAKGDYKKQCNKPYLVALDKLDDLQNFDDRLDLTCCSYNRWESCVLNLTEKACNGTGRQNMYNFLDKAFAGLSNLFCKQEDFDFHGSKCVALLPLNDTISLDSNSKSFNSTNPITKYLTSYFGFFFGK